MASFEFELFAPIVKCTSLTLDRNKKMLHPSNIRRIVPDKGSSSNEIDNQIRFRIGVVLVS